MDKYRFLLRDRRQERQRNPDSRRLVQVLPRWEEEVLKSIATQAPLPEVLNRICSALDYQIGNVVSLISLLEGDLIDRVAIAGKASDFGLYAFCCADIVAESGEPLGSLGMYCCVPRSPSIEEFSLIERVECLAATVIEQYNEAREHENRRIPRHRRTQDFVLKLLPAMN